MLIVKVFGKVIVLSIVLQLGMDGLIRFVNTWTGTVRKPNIGLKKGAKKKQINIRQEKNSKKDAGEPMLQHTEKSGLKKSVHIWNAPYPIIYIGL